MVRYIADQIGLSLPIKSSCPLLTWPIRNNKIDQIDRFLMKLARQRKKCNVQFDIAGVVRTVETWRELEKLLYIISSKTFSNTSSENI